MTSSPRVRIRSAAALALLALTACAPPSDGGTTPTDPAATGPTGAGPTSTDPTSAEPTATDPATTDERRTLLEVTVRTDGTAEPVQHVLECIDGAPGPATTHPDPETACADVAELGPEFFTAERDPDLACTQQWGGPQTAHVVGTVDGEAVDTRFSRTDGCEISRWDAVESLLGPGGVQEEPAGPPQG